MWLAVADATEPGVIERILPDGCVEVIVHLADPFFRWTSPRLREGQERGFVIGQLTRFLLLEPGSRVRTLGIRFRPGGAAPILGLPVHELTDRAVPLADVLGPAGRILEERLQEAPADRDLAGIAFAFLTNRLVQGSVPEARIQAVVRNILRSGGEEPVAALAGRVGWSPRQLERCFRSAVGLGPKAFSRVIRFQNALRVLGTTPRPSWVSLALDSGYFDQAHMIRDFRRLAGETPGRLVTGGPLARHFTSPERLTTLLEGSTTSF